MERYFIIGKERTTPFTVYRVLAEKTEPNGSTSYTRLLEEETTLASGRVAIVNAAYSGCNEPGKMLKGLTGDLSRFESKPLVILAEFVSSKGRVLGYKVADYNGEVRSLKLNDLLDFCLTKEKHRETPIQNGIVIKETPTKAAHIRCYTDGEFPRIVLEQTKPKAVEKPKVSIPTNEKKLSRLEELFSIEQINELKLGKKHGVDIRIYGDNALTAKQMSIIREALEAGLPAKKFANPAYSVPCMKLLALDLKFKCDISFYLNPKLTVKQMDEISTGVISGVDVSQYADPSISAEEMAEIRMRLENGIWKAHKTVYKDTSSK